jgi:hypothetical protein
MVTNQMKQMTIHPSTNDQAMTSTISTIHSSDVHVVYSMTLKGTQNLEGRRRVRIRREVETTIKMLNLMQMLGGTRRRRKR